MASAAEIERVQVRGPRTRVKFWAILMQFRNAQRSSWSLTLASCRRALRRKFPPALVVVVAGESFDESRWGPDLSTGMIDIAILSYAKPGSVTCRACVHVRERAGPGWSLWDCLVAPRGMMR